MLRFTKMEGLGNDYIYLNCLDRTPDNLPELAKKLSDRHFGVGADGLICICPSQRADVKMRIFNADGSEGEMCGNGIRCVGKYVYDKGIVPKLELEVETLAGVKQLFLSLSGNAVGAVTVDMGVPVPSPVCSIDVGGKEYRLTPISMGNPHAVVFVEDPGVLDLPALGPKFECHPAFPHRTNTEFVKVCAPDRLAMRVWERGSGETLACGTGACAALVAAALEERVPRQAAVDLPGGTLYIRWAREDGHVYMTGPATTVFEGEMQP